MKKIMLLFTFTHLLLYSLAQQPCNDDLIMNKKGSWKKTSNANMKAGQSQVTSRIDKMQKILQAAYPQPMGIEAKWYRSMHSNPLIASGPIPYQLNSLFPTYFCNPNNNNKIEAGEETGTWSYVWANHFNWFAKTIEYFTVQQQPVFLLTPKTGELNGYPLYKGIHNENSNTGIKYSRAIIITRDGQMPYTSVTKKQYLQAFLNYNEKKLPEELAAFEKNTPVKTDEQEEAFKKKQLENIDKSTIPDKAKAKEYFLRGYVTDKQRKEKWIADTKKRYEKEMKPVQELLTNSSDVELQQPAIIKFLDITSFKGFSTEAQGGGQLVRLNPDYFKMNLPKYVPQFFIMYWRWDKKKPAENFKEQLEANFNFIALKEMLDK